MTTKAARSLGRYMAAWLAEAAIGGAIALAIANAETNLFILSGTDPTSTPPGNVSRHRAGRPGGRTPSMRCGSRTARSPTTAAWRACIPQYRNSGRNRRSSCVPARQGT